MTWNEFWILNNGPPPVDHKLYLANVKDVVERLRIHPCVAHYCATNECERFIPGTEELIMEIDGTRTYQPQSECCGRSLIGVLENVGIIINITTAIDIVRAIFIGIITVQIRKLLGACGVGILFPRLRCTLLWTLTNPYTHNMIF